MSLLSEENISKVLILAFEVIVQPLVHTLSMALYPIFSPKWSSFILPLSFVIYLFKYVNNKFYISISAHQLENQSIKLLYFLWNQVNVKVSTVPLLFSYFSVYILKILIWLKYIDIFCKYSGGILARKVDLGSFFITFKWNE